MNAPRISRALGLALGLTLGLGLAAPRAARAQAAPANPTQEGESLLRQGVQLRQQGRDEDALEAFRRAYELTHGARALGQMALAEQALGRWVDAHEHMTETLRAAADPWVNSNQAVLQTALATINEHVGRVIVNANVPGAEVLVGSRVVGTTPLREPVRAVVGTAAITLRAPRYIAMTRTVNVTAGSLTRETFELVPDPNAPAGPAAPAAGAGNNGAAGRGAGNSGAQAGAGAAQPARGGTSPVLWLGVGLTAAAGGAALAFSLMGSSAGGMGLDCDAMGMAMPAAQGQCYLDNNYYQGYADAASLGANIFWGVAGAGVATTVVGVVLTVLNANSAPRPPASDEERDRDRDRDREEARRRGVPGSLRAAVRVEPAFGGVRVAW